jgi:chemosensory pili system protein ChpA (sensor histidine kinase/response regulator)
VVDDNEIILRSMAAKLRHAGYEPYIALDGLEAVTVARDITMDLILLDINFPPDVYGQAWDGFSILNWLRRLENNRQTPVIMISSSTHQQDWNQAREQGVAAFFPKPIDHADLLHIIRDTLESSAVAAA